MTELVCVKDFEEYARNNLPNKIFSYFRGGAGQEATLENNRSAFSKLRIKPRFLIDVSKRDLSTVILGNKISMPIGISPTGIQKMAHIEGECANARAAQASGTVFILSNVSTYSIEEVAEAAPHAIKWFQMFIYKDRNLTIDLVRRVEKAGFKGIVLTVDAPLIGLRLNDLRNKFAIPSHLRFANFIKYNFTEKDTLQGTHLLDPSLTWDDLKWFQTVTDLPIILKGILTKEDAQIAADLKVQGILVSNHGARQIDGVPATIEALPEITTAVGGKLEIYLDGGVTDGTDVLRALALGAKMVFIGRPALWGLVYDGENGVKRILDILKQDFDYTLALTGCSTPSDISRNMVVHENYYARL